VCLLGLLGATGTRIALEVFALMKTELAEASEPAPPGTVGSSTMPHKRNPQLSDDCITIGAQLRALVPLALEGMLHDHEVDGAHSAMLDDALERACVLAGDLLVRLEVIVSGLEVDPARMRANLTLSDGMISSEAVMLGLGQAIGRQTAHEVVYDAARGESTTFAAALKHDPRVTAHLDAAAIDRLLDPAGHTGLSEDIARAAAQRPRSTATPRTVPGRYSGSPLTPGARSPTSKSVCRSGSRSSSLRVRWISKAQSAPVLGGAAVSAGLSPGTTARDAFRHAGAGDVGDAAHGAGEPAVVELQGAGQVGALTAVDVVPSGGQGRQLPDGVDVAGPAVPQLITGVVSAEHGIGPLPQLGQLRRVGLAVQANPVRGGRTAGRGRVQGAGHCLGEFLKAGGQVQIAAEPGLVEPFVDHRDLPAQGRYLDSQGGQALAERLSGRFSLRAGHRPSSADRGPAMPVSLRSSSAI
jgi:hypothetical protein